MMLDRRWWTATAVTVVLVFGCKGKTDSAATRIEAPTPDQADSLAAAGQRVAPGTGGGATGIAELLPAVLPQFGADSADVPLSLTLAQIGYRGGITLLGALDEATLSVPVNPGLRPDSMRLRIMPTPGMPAGTMVLRQRERIIAIRLLTDTTTAMSLPLSDLIVEQGKATFTLGVSVPGPDVCQAQLYYRTNIEPGTLVTFTGTPVRNGSINAFFAPWVGRITFYLADLPSIDAAQATLDAAAFVARR